jgi:hypothetical protein
MGVLLLLFNPERILMYLARKRIKNILHYFIREAVIGNHEQVHSQELVDLGSDPSEYIIYPGGHSFYIDQIIQQRLEEAGIDATQEDLEEIFWPFLKPDIKRALDPFRSRSKARNRGKITSVQDTELRTKTHLFDKRRMHYLKFGRMNQRYVEQISGKFLKDLEGKSRDEIEQYFWISEKQVLKSHEFKTYVYVIFNLDRFFMTSSARNNPEQIDENLLDEYFLKEICLLNNADNFWMGEVHGQNLNDYLVRYLIMFFDNDFVQRNLADDFLRDFVNQHRAFRGYPQKVTVSIKEASTIFEVSEETLNTISKPDLISLYRRLAQKHHPDLGGEHERFIRLTEAYQATMRKRRFSIK